MNTYSPVASGGNTAGANNIRAFLQQAVDSYPPLAVTDADHHDITLMALIIIINQFCRVAFTKPLNQLKKGDKLWRRY